MPGRHITSPDGSGPARIADPPATLRKQRRSHGARSLFRIGISSVRLPREDIPEFTAKAILLGIFFGILFGAATVYLALRAGLTVSASVPIAVLAIAVFKRSASPRSSRTTSCRRSARPASRWRRASSSRCRPALPRRRRASISSTPDLVLAIFGGTLGVLFMIPAAPRADRQGARQPAVPRGHGLRGRAHRAGEVEISPARCSRGLPLPTGKRT